MEEFKPNSFKSKEEETAVATTEQSAKNVESVAKSKVQGKKKSELRKFKDVFISEDISGVKDYVIFDVMIPAIRDAVVDTLVNAIYMIFTGENKTSRETTRPGNGAQRIRYSRMYDDARERPREVRRTPYDYDDVIFATKTDAEAVLMRMFELIEQYKCVTVGDFYDLAGYKDGTYLDNKYGWVGNELRSAAIIRTRDGWQIKLPRVGPLD